MKNRKYHCFLHFAIHFYFSNIFPNFSRGLIFANDNFRDILRELNFMNGKFRNNSNNNSNIFHGKDQNPGNPQNIIHAKINPLKVFL